MARDQARSIASEIATQGGPRGLEGKKIVALVAYLQRLGSDIKKTPGVAPPAPATPVAETGRSGPHALRSPSSSRGEGI
jgi:cytochrome c oxidase cbb3-type subunit I/II